MMDWSRFFVSHYYFANWLFSVITWLCNGNGDDDAVVVHDADMLSLAENPAAADGDAGDILFFIPVGTRPQTRRRRSQMRLIPCSFKEGANSQSVKERIFGSCVSSLGHYFITCSSLNNLLFVSGKVLLGQLFLKYHNHNSMVMI